MFYKVQRRELKQMVVVVSFQVRQLPGEASDNFCLILGKSKCWKQIKSGSGSKWTINYGIPSSDFQSVTAMIGLFNGQYWKDQSPSYFWSSALFMRFDFYFDKIEGNSLESLELQWSICCFYDPDQAQSSGPARPVKLTNIFGSQNITLF